MATITQVCLFWRNSRSEPSVHVYGYKYGRLKWDGRGTSFTFWPLGVSIVEVPLVDQFVTLSFKVRTRDFLEVAVDGEVRWVAADPAQLTERYDFSINPAIGAYNADPLKAISDAVTSIAQQVVWTYTSLRDLDAILRTDVSEIDKLVTAALGSFGGITLRGVTIKAIRPTAAVEKALATVKAESLQREADNATFERRENTARREQSLAISDLDDKKSLEVQRSALIEQKARNERAEAEAAAEVAQLRAGADVAALRLNNDEALSLQREQDAAKLGAEQSRLDLYKALDDDAAARLYRITVAESLGHVDTLNLGAGGIESALLQVAQSR